MNKQQFDVLKMATESYLDGFEAAIEVVKSLNVRVGDKGVDEVFISNRNTVVSTLEVVLKRMKDNELGI